MWQYNYSPELYHYGVLGMKWGHRKDKKVESYTIKTKNGEDLTLKRKQYGLFGKSLEKISPKTKEAHKNEYSYNAYVNGKKVGRLWMDKVSKDEMNINWGDTKKKYRGRGYMQAMIKIGEQVARQSGAKRLTAELVGTSPDIHTVAKKANFVKVGESRVEDGIDVWGGLTLVEKKLK